MIEMNPIRKNKISLADYEYQRDIENRLLMAQFNALDLEVLEEILYSSLTIPIKKLARNLDIPDEKLLASLEKLKKTELFTLVDETIIVNKEMRKYYESQILKFDDDFKPGMEFLQGLLRKVPIHVLPNWYSIPRSSNNIFDSIVEKYLYTPQIFQRYLMELNFGDSTLLGMIHDVYNAPDFQVPSFELIEKYNLSREQFEEYMLHLEFSFVCCLGYRKINDQWIEVATPFYEWTEYLRFMRDTVPPPIKDVDKIHSFRPHEFGFIQDLAVILSCAKKQPIALDIASDGSFYPQKNALNQILSKCESLKGEDPRLKSYLNRLISKLRLVKLADIIDGRLYALEAANDFLDMRQENRALFLYRHPMNHLLSDNIPVHLYTERNLREAEKSIQRVLSLGWILFDDFAKGLLVSLSESSTIVLKKVGKTWKYTLPEYTEDEYALIKATVLEWLYEAGVVAKGVKDGKDCFCVTPFGQSLFGR